MTDIDKTCPFHIQLGSNTAEDSVQCVQLLRALPGKRLVYKGTWRHQPVIVKLFIDPRNAERHWRRESAGVEAIKDACVYSPEVLFSGHLDEGTPVLVFGFLPDALTAKEVWNSLITFEAKAEFLRHLVELVGSLHDAGLVQEDLHLENFLVSNQQIYAIDGDAIRVQKKGEPLDVGACIKNLSLLFAQLYPEDDVLIDDATLHYAMQRNMSAELLQTSLKRTLPDIRRKRRHKYVKKCYRTCQEFVRVKRLDKVEIFRREAQGETLNKLLEDPDFFMRDGEILKDGKTSTVVRVQIDGHDWVVKRYNMKSFWHVLSRCFRATRASVSWGNAHRLKISGIATPKAIAMIEKRFGPLRSTGYFVCDFVGGPRAEVLFRDQTVDSCKKEQAAKGFVLLFELFYKLGISHGDCKAANFLPRDQKAPWVIDLDAMHECFSRIHFERLFKADRSRFLCNWRSQPEWLKWFDENLPK